MRITELRSTEEVEIDRISRGIIVTQHGESDIHDGETYSVSVLGTALASSTVTDGSDIFSIGFRTGPDNNAHVTFSAFASGQFQIDLFRGSSLSGLGTAVIPENRLQGGDASEVAVFVNSSSTGTTGFGVNRLTGISPGGNLIGNQTFGGGRAEFDEWIFTTASTGVLRLRNLTTAALDSFSLALGFSQERP